MTVGIRSRHGAGGEGFVGAEVVVVLVVDIVVGVVEDVVMADVVVRSTQRPWSTASVLEFTQA